MTLSRGTSAVRREAAIGLLVGAAVVAGLWSAPPDTAPATVTIDPRRLPVGKAAEVPWAGSRAFAGVTASGELGRRADLGRTPPLSVSPDGTYAVARYDERIMLVFRTDTGYPLFDLDVGAGFNRRVTWEPDGDLLLDVWQGGKVIAVRCTMTAECERAGGAHQSPRRTSLAAFPSSVTRKVSYEQHRLPVPNNVVVAAARRPEPRENQRRPVQQAPHARREPDRAENGGQRQWPSESWLTREQADRLRRLAADYRRQADQHRIDDWRRSDRARDRTWWRSRDFSSFRPPGRP